MANPPDEFQDFRPEGPPDQIWAAARLPAPDAIQLDPAKGWQSLQHRLAVPRRRRALRLTWVSTAAVLAAAAVFCLVWWSRPLFTSNESTPQYATTAGERLAITLSDGTRAILGPATHLRVANGFGQRERAVELDGEALFTVVHNQRHPFVVHTSRATVRDVGTVFDVQAYTSDPSMRVVVAEGEVAIGSQSLTAGGAATLTAGRLAMTRSADVNAALAWAQGRLVFDATPLREVVRQLSRTYNLQITVPDSSLGAKLVTASFATEPVNEILDIVTHVVGAHYDRTGRHVVIRPAAVALKKSEARPATLNTVQNETRE